MKAKLNKVDNGYVLLVDNIMYATDNDKLSKQNCDEIFGVVDFGKLANYEYPIGDDWSPEESLVRKLAFLNGVDKAMELNKDKLFTLEDMELMFEFGYRKNNLIETTFEGGLNFIQSLQQPTEIEVEIEMEYYDPLPPTRQTALRPKLDENGCLTLKRI